MSRKRTVHVRPPSLCELEISLQGVKLIMSLEDEYDALDEVQVNEISFVQSPFTSLIHLQSNLCPSISQVRQM